MILQFAHAEAPLTTCYDAAMRNNLPQLLRSHDLWIGLILLLGCTIALLNRRLVTHPGYLAICVIGMISGAYFFWKSLRAPK